MYIFRYRGVWNKLKKQITVELNDLFHLQPTLKEVILAQIKKDKRTSPHLIAKLCKCSESSAKRNLELLVSDGLVKGLGYFRIKNGKTRVYEVI